MPTLTTHGIRVKVETRFQEEHSKPEESKYLFTYDVHIENGGTESVQLLRRHWAIFDSCGGKRTVEGEGVVGEQPVLEPGQVHTYRSWCPLISGLGTMDGFYIMERIRDGEEIEVGIPKFDLIAPVKFN